MKTRKVTRKTLEELAKIMPVLTEDEQRECTGRAHYYSLISGHYVGSAGPGDEIRIIDPCYFPNRLDNSTSFSECNDEWFRTQVMRAALTHCNITGVIVDADFFKKPEMNSGIGCHTDKGEIYFNPNSAFFQNEADVRLTLVHELSHKSNPGLSTDSTYVKAQKEYNAYYAQKNSPYFSQASATARASIEANITKYWKIMQENKP